MVVGDDLERQGLERVRSGLAAFAHDIVGRGQVVHHGIEQGLHTPVLEGRAGERGHEGACQHTLADGGAQHVHSDLVTVHVGLQGSIVLLHRCFDQARAAAHRLL